MRMSRSPAKSVATGYRWPNISGKRYLDDRKEIVWATARRELAFRLDHNEP